MKLSKLQIPTTFLEMLDTYESYYSNFYLEMIRMSNSSLNQYIKSYISLISELSKDYNSPNAIRSAIGIVSLYTFGYNDFYELSRIFDRLLPQINSEYIMFTSWCVGKLIHHPNAEQSRYVTHLFDRFIGWLRAYGRRARPLAAACLLKALSINAGSNVVTFYPVIQTILWDLISHPSQIILLNASEAIYYFTRAMMRYKRNDLCDYLKIVTNFALKLLNDDNLVNEYSGLLILKCLIMCNPDFYAARFNDIFEILSAKSSESLLIKSSIFCAIASLSSADPKQFLETAADFLFKENQCIKVLISKFPKNICLAICLLISNIPNYFLDKMDLIKEFINLFMKVEPNSVFDLCINILIQYEGKVIPIISEIYRDLIKCKITEEYHNFIIEISKFKEEITDSFVELLTEQILKQFEIGISIHTLKILSIIPQYLIHKHLEIIDKLKKSINLNDDKIRKLVYFSLANIIGFDDVEEERSSIIDLLFQIALYDKSLSIRVAVLTIFRDHPSNFLPNNKFYKLIKNLSNDESFKIKKLCYQILEKIYYKNPIFAVSITRKALKSSFFVLHFIQSIKQKKEIGKILPSLIKSSSEIMVAYSKEFLNIFVNLLKEHKNKHVFNNFIEENSYYNYLKNMLKSLSLLAPIDPDVVSEYLDEFIPSVCSLLNNEENRNVTLHAINLLNVLLTPPSSTIYCRIKGPYILAECSKFLKITCSRKVKMALFKLIGALGVIEVHQKSVKTYIKPPENIDSEMTRKFYNPLRENDGLVDESLLFNPSSVTHYFIDKAASLLLELFYDDTIKDLHYKTAEALVYILSNPKMHTLSHFDSFLTRLLTKMEKFTDSELKSYLPLYTSLVLSSTSNTVVFIQRTLKLIHERFNINLAPEFLNLIIAFLKTVHDGFSTNISETISLLLGCLEETITSNVIVSCRILKAFTIFGLYSNDLLPLIIPQICNIIECKFSLNKVRVSALKTLDKLAQQIELSDYCGSLIRALIIGIYSDEQKMRSTAIKLLCTLLKTHGSLFLNDIDLVLHHIKTKHLQTTELIEILDKTKHNNSQEFQPIKIISKKEKQETENRIGNFIFSEDTIISEIAIPSLRIEKRNLDQYFRSFILNIIQNSPSESIRICSSLATNYYPFAKKLFNISFLSCWLEFSEKSKKYITIFFKEILLSNDNNKSIKDDIIQLLVFMNQIEKPVNISTNVLMNSNMQYTTIPYVIKIQSDIINKYPNNTKEILRLIDLYLQYGDTSDAIGLWRRKQDLSDDFKDPELLAKLQMWDKVNFVFKRKFKEIKNFKTYSNLIKLMHANAKWKEIDQIKEYFYLLPRHQKQLITSYIGESLLYLGNWDELKNILKYSSDDCSKSNILSALCYLHERDFENVEKCINQGFSLLASRPLMSLDYNQQINRSTIIECQELVEIIEMENWIKGIQRKEIEKVWAERLKTFHNFDLWPSIIVNRSSIINIRNEELVNIYSLKSLDNYKQKNILKVIFPTVYNISPKESDLNKVCYSIGYWINGEKTKAIEEIKNLINHISTPLKYHCEYLYSKWLLEENNSICNLIESYEHLEKIVDDIDFKNSFQKTIELNQKTRKNKESNYVLPSQVFYELNNSSFYASMLRKWCNVNISLISIDNSFFRYVINAIDALTKCELIQPSFPDLVQLLDLFFTYSIHEEVFNSGVHKSIEKLSPKQLLQASPQILVQLNHPKSEVANFVHHIVFNLLKEHYHELIFPVFVMMKSVNKERKLAAKKLLEEFREFNPEVYDEVFLIRSTLPLASITWTEKALQFIFDAFNYFQKKSFHQMKMSITAIIDLVKEPKCQMHEHFINTYGKYIRILKDLLPYFNIKYEMNISMTKIINLCKKMKEALDDELRQIRTIELSSISTELSSKTDFHLAVPGTYKPGHLPNKIKYFVGQLSVYMSKQIPKDVIIKGSDGNFYQYLLKGHEDLRLDERIMQFFRLINSLIAKESLFNGNFIQIINVIPLSVDHGLVKWVPGTETFRKIIEKIRAVHNIDNMLEFSLIKEYSTESFDNLLPIQKMQILEKIYENSPDSDISDFFWLTAPNSEVWLKHVHTFSISAAINSIVGYIIGLGDRHPSNLLIDSNSGKIIHIDFGDCFEKASKREYLPEIVPFRLTRQFVKAFGPPGVDGCFKDSFICMSNILRQNSDVLVMVLAIFVQEPLINPVTPEDIKRLYLGESLGNVMLDNLNEKTSNLEIRKRVQEKLTGMDFNNNEPLSVEEQAKLLINMATDSFALSKMYSGWCPFW